MLAALHTSRAQVVIDVTWEGGVGNFSDRNWRTTLSLISLVGIDFNLRVDGGKATNSIVDVTTSPTIRDLGVSQGDTLNIVNGQSLTLSPIGGNGNVSNNGTLSLSNTFSTTDLVISGGTVTFAGTGAVTLGNHSNNRLLGAAPTDHLVNASGHTIQGSGHLGADLLKITNAGLIVANQSIDLIIDPSSGGLLNTNGILRATNGATLILRNGTFNNTGGLIEAQMSSHVDFDAATITGGTLTSNGTGHFHASNLTSFANVTLSSGSNVEVPNGQRLLLSGTLTNQGTVSLLSSINATELVSSGNVTLTGTGTVVLSDHPNNRIVGVAAKDVLTNESIISGAGQIGANSVGLVNLGLILADKSTPLTIDPSSAGVVNRGVLRADNATLNLSDGTFTNEKDGVWGLIEATNGGRVHLNAATISGGLVSSDSGSVIRNVGTATLERVFLVSDTQFVADNGTLTTLVGQISNYGTISLNASSHNTDLVIAPGGATLDGFGTLALSNHANNRVLGSASLTNASGHTIRGSGQLGAGQLTLTNLGDIVADQSTPLTIDVAPTASIENHGMFRATNGASLVAADHTSNRGLVLVENASTFNAAAGFTQTSGAIMLDGGTFTASSAIFSGGILLGSGTINGPVTNGGVISPGTGERTAGLGLLAFNHSLTLTPTSLLHFEIGSSSTVDRIQAQSATLDGALVITFGTGLTGTLLPTDTFTLLTTTGTLGLSGTFAGLANGSRFFTADGAGSFQINYFNNALTISAFQPIPEPSTYVLLGMGALAVLVAGRRRRR